MSDPTPPRYVRARIRVASETSDPDAYNRYIEERDEIAKRLRVWSDRLVTRRQRGNLGVHPIDGELATLAAADILAAVNRAKKSGPVTAEVWDAYVGLHRSLLQLNAALRAVAELPYQYQHLQSQLAELGRVTESLTEPVCGDDGEVAGFRSDRARLIFQKKQRGRSKSVRGEIVRQAIAVWLHRFKELPPAYAESVFDELLRRACEFHGMKGDSPRPGISTIRAEIAEFKPTKVGAENLYPLRFYPGPRVK